MKNMARVVALIGALALVAGACGQRPNQEDSSGGGAQGNSDFRACMVTDSGGIDDRSFNAVTWDGMEQAEDEFGITTDFLESNSNSDFAPNINQFVQQDCNLIVTVGFLLGDATEQAAESNSEQKFAIVDETLDVSTDNVKSLVFNTAEAAFLGGYLAAGMTESGTVATFGGQKIPSVTIFMDGYWSGVQHYNEQHGTDVEVLGWDKDSQEGVFTGDFEDQAKGRQVTENFIQQGADIIHPVAGPVGLGSAAAAEDAGDRVSLIWVDTDGCRSAPQHCDLFLSSVVKSIDTAVKDVVETTMNGNYTSEPYVGTLENGGVSLAPYHEHSDDVPEELKQQIKQVEEDIVSGEIEVTSPSTPEQ